MLYPFEVKELSLRVKQEILVICQDHVFFYRSVSSFKLSASILNVTLKRVHMTKT